MTESDPPEASQTRIVASSPDWHLSGVNVFTARLFRELRRRGWDTSVVLTNPTAETCERASFPDDLEVVRFPPTSNRAIRKRQAMLREFLASQAPCVYLPNYDFDTAGVVPTLPVNVATIGVLHSDEPHYYQFAMDLGAWMDGLVVVSEEIQRKLNRLAPALAPRTRRIPYGIIMRSDAPGKPAPYPLRVVYAGRLSHYQKRVQDLAAIIARCHDQRLPIEFEIAGDGPDREAFVRTISQAVESGSARIHGTLSGDSLRTLLDSSHVLILTSEFEGLPIALLEGVESGCVPVVSRIRSGVDELVTDNETGLTFDVGDVRGAVECLQKISLNVDLGRSLAIASRNRLASSSWTIASAAESYATFMEWTLDRRHSGAFAPSPGRAFIPRHHRLRTRAAVRWAQLVGRLRAAQAGSTK